MKKGKGTTKASELRQTYYLAATIPQYKAMGFRVDSKINSLAENMKAMLDYVIGDKLKECKDGYDKVLEEVKAPFLAEFTEQTKGLDEDEKNKIGLIFDGKIQKELAENEDFKRLKREEDDLWNTDIEIGEKDFKLIEIEEKDYDLKFTLETPGAVEYRGVQFKVDGYYALLSLITKGFIEVAETVES